MNLRQNRYLWRALLVLLLSYSVSEVALHLGWLNSMESIYYDLWHQLAGQRATPKHVAIVSIDDQTLAKHRDDPLAFWGPHFALTIEVLRRAGVHSIGIDFLFSVSAESWLNKITVGGSDISRTYDIPFRTQLNSGDVVLAGVFSKDDNGKNTILLPINEYLFSLPNGHSDIGLANLYYDNDGVVRNFVPKLFNDHRSPSLTMAALVAAKFQKSGLQQIIEQGERADWPQNYQPGFIGYLGPPGTIPRVSMNRLLAPGADEDPAVKVLKNKVVIISAENSGNNDVHQTPYRNLFLFSSNGFMSGAEVHANIVETILTNKAPHLVPTQVSLLWRFISISTGIFLFLRFRPVSGGGILLVICIICSVCAYYAFVLNWILPLANIQLGLGIGYIGSLGLRFTQEEQRRFQLQRFFTPYVSDTVMEKMMASGNQPDLGGETIKMTVLFSDIRSFTTISELLSPHEVVEMLNHYFTLIYKPIVEQGGIVDKFIGDAVMAIFGAPVPYDDQAKRALIAAGKMIDIAYDFQTWLADRFPDRNLPKFKIGIGIHTGEAVIGNIGSTKRMGYTAIGDAVNISSRLEGMTKKLGWDIIASQATIDSAGPGVKTDGRETVQPKGRTGQIVIYEIPRQQIK